MKKGKNNEVVRKSPRSPRNNSQGGFKHAGANQIHGGGGTKKQPDRNKNGRMGSK